MEPLYKHPVDGQVVSGSDLEMISAAASYADERSLGELAQVMPFDGTTFFRGVMPFSPRGLAHTSGPVPTARGVVTASGSADGSSRVWPFRAFIGPNSNASAYDAQRAIKTCVYAPAGGFTSLIHPAATNNRWDLIVAVVSTNLPVASSRRVQVAPSSFNTQSVIARELTSISLARISGTEATSPTRPAIPADSPNAFVIPLAYVRIPAGHALNSTINRRYSYHFAAKVVPRNGDIRPATVNSKLPTPSGGDLSPETSSVPKMFMDGSACGGERLIFRFRQQDFTAGTDVLIDDSIDWRNRSVKLVGKVSASSTGNIDFAGQQGTSTSPTPFPAGLSSSPTVTELFNTFVSGTIDTSIVDVMRLDANVTAFAWNGAGDTFRFRVHKGTGALYLNHTIGAGSTFIGEFWLEASAQFGQAGQFTGNGPLPGA